MPMDARDIESMIKAAIPDAEVTIRDLAGDGDHYAATVLAESFRGKSRVQQHQIVYEALKAEMGASSTRSHCRPAPPRPNGRRGRAKTCPGRSAARSGALQTRNLHG